MIWVSVLRGKNAKPHYHKTFTRIAIFVPCSALAAGDLTSFGMRTDGYHYVNGAPLSKHRSIEACNMLRLWNVSFRILFGHGISHTLELHPGYLYDKIWNITKASKSILKYLSGYQNRPWRKDWFIYAVLVLLFHNNIFW